MGDFFDQLGRGLGCAIVSIVLLALGLALVVALFAWLGPFGAIVVILLVLILAAVSGR